MEHNQIDKLCNSANARFKKVSKSKNQKFAYLPDDLHAHSRNFQNEMNGIFKEKFYYYKRGSIVMIDFGVNIGSQFSGRHFAIVLNKKDSPYNSTLTVIPLTSKKGKYRVALGNELFVEVQNQLEKEIISIYERIETIVDKLLQIQKDTIKTVERAQLFVSKAHAKYDNPYNNSSFSDKDNLLAESLIRETATNLALLEKHDNELKVEQQKLTKEAEDFKAAKIFYDKYDKNSYARVNDITSISKMKIFRINKKDPSGKIAFSDEVMAILSKQIEKNLLSN